MNAKEIEFTKNLQKTIFMVGEHISFPDIFDAAKISKRERSSILSGRTASQTTYENILQALNITHSRVIADNVDINCIVKAFQNEEYSHYDYQKIKTSKKLASYFILNQVKQNRPNTFLDELYSELQISKHFINSSNLAETTSIKLSCDILQFLDGQSDNFHGELLGRMAVVSAPNPELTNQLFGLSLKQAYELLFEELISKFEESHNYRIIKLSEDTLVTRKTQKLEVVEAYRGVVGSPVVCDYLHGFGSAIAFFITGKFAPFFETKCVFRGDPYCECVFNLKDLSETPFISQIIG